MEFKTNRSIDNAIRLECTCIVKRKTRVRP